MRTIISPSSSSGRQIVSTGNPNVDQIVQSSSQLSSGQDFDLGKALWDLPGNTVSDVVGTVGAVGGMLGKGLSEAGRTYGQMVNPAEWQKIGQGIQDQGGIVNVVSQIPGEMRPGLRAMGRSLENEYLPPEALQQGNDFSPIDVGQVLQKGPGFLAQRAFKKPFSTALDVASFGVLKGVGELAEGTKYAEPLTKAGNIVEKASSAPIKAMTAPVGWVSSAGKTMLSVLRESPGALMDTIVKTPKEVFNGIRNGIGQTYGQFLLDEGIAGKLNTANKAEFVGSLTKNFKAAAKSLREGLQEIKGPIDIKELVGKDLDEMVLKHADTNNERAFKAASEAAEDIKSRVANSAEDANEMKREFKDRGKSVALGADPVTEAASQAIYAKASKMIQSKLESLGKTYGVKLGKLNNRYNKYDKILQDIDLKAANATGKAPHVGITGVASGVLAGAPGVAAVKGAESLAKSAAMRAKIAVAAEKAMRVTDKVAEYTGPVGQELKKATLATGKSILGRQTARSTKQ